MRLSLIFLGQELIHTILFCHVFHQRAKHVLDQILLHAVSKTWFLTFASEAISQGIDELLAVLESRLPEPVKAIAGRFKIAIGSLDELDLEDSALKLNRILHVLDDRF